MECKKCGKKINPHYGYLHWENVYPQVGGYYHTDCGMILNPASVEFKTQLDRLSD